MSSLFDDLTNNRYENNRVTTSFQYTPELGTVFTYEQTEMGELKNDELFQSLAEVIRGIFKFQSFDDISPYKYQKSVPSARSIHAHFPYIIYFGHLLIYDVFLDELILLDYDNRKKDAIEVIIAADQWRTCAVYGRFGLALNLLDLGHIIADFRLSRFEKGLGIKRVAYMFNRKEYMDKFRIGSDIMLGCLIELQGNRNHANIIPKLTQNYDKKYQYEKELKQIGVLDYMNQLLCIDSVDVEREWNNDAIQQKTFPNSGGDRSSYNSYFGLMDISDKYPFVPFQNLLNWLQKNLQQLTNGNKLKLYIVIQNVQDWEKGSYLFTMDGLKMIHQHFETDSFLYDTQEFFNLERSPFLLYVSYQLEEEEEETAAIYFSHVLAAELIQSITRFLLEKGLYARPLKNINDRYCHDIFHFRENERVIYSLACGMSNAKREKYRGNR